MIPTFGIIIQVFTMDKLMGKTNNSNVNTVPEVPVVKKRRHILRNWQLILMAVPALTSFILFNYLPMYGILLAFKDYNPLIGIWGSEWIGFTYFETMFSDPKFFQLIINIFRIALLNLAFSFPAPIIMAILLNEVKKEGIKKFVQTVIYIPYFISWVVISGIMLKIFKADGPVNSFLKLMGAAKGIGFFSSSGWFLFLVIFSGIWRNTGYSTIIFLASLSTINPELYEAAEIDGANRWQRIRYISLPGMLPAISISLILFISSMMGQPFDQIFNLYNPTVYEVADIIGTYVYRIGITGGKYGLGTAIDLFNQAISLIFVLVGNTVIKKIGGVGLW